MTGFVNKILKHLVLIQISLTQNLYKTLLEEIKAFEKKNTVCSMTELLDTITIHTLSKIVYKCNAAPTKIPVACFTDTKISIIKLTLNFTGPENKSQNSFENSVGFNLSDYKIYFKAIT